MSLYVDKSVRLYITYKYVAVYDISVVWRRKARLHITSIHHAAMGVAHTFHSAYFSSSHTHDSNQYFLLQQPFFYTLITKLCQSELLYHQRMFEHAVYYPNIELQHQHLLCHHIVVQYILSLYLLC